MAQFEKWFTQDLTQPVEIRHCESIVFTGDNLSNLVGVNLYVDGEPYSGGGVVKGNVLLSNGVTVPLTGTLDGNKASIVLTSGCFILPGLVGVSIRIDSGNTKTTVLSAVFTCVQSETDSTIDPGTIIPSVQDLIDDINDAVGSIPPDYSALLATIAPNFSASTAYSAGQYIWNSGTLYRFTVDHAAGAWTGTDAAAAVIGGELNKAVRYDYQQTLTDPQKAQARGNVGAADVDAYADTPVTYWGADGSSTLSGRTLQRANGHDYTISGTPSGNLYYKLDGALGVISTTSGANAWTGTIDLEENTRYSLTVIPLSGAFTGTEGFYVALRTPDNTNVCTVNMLSGKQRSVSFVWNDSTEKGKLILRVQQNIVTDTSFTFRVLITKCISEDGCVDVSGTTPNIVAVPGTVYNCVGTGSYVSPVAVTELTFVPSERGVCSVRFVSGTTPTVLTIPNTVKMPGWWNGCAANTTYEISIADGVYGAVGVWT